MTPDRALSYTTIYPKSISCTCSGRVSFLTCRHVAQYTCSESCRSRHILRSTIPVNWQEEHQCYSTVCSTATSVPGPAILTAWKTKRGSAVAVGKPAYQAIAIIMVKNRLYPAAGGQGQYFLLAAILNASTARTSKSAKPPMSYSMACPVRSLPK